MNDQTLFVVEDDENLRAMLCAALAHHGFTTHAAANGREALNLVDELRPDLILLDVMMPEIDGLEVCRRLRSSGDQTPILFLTARATTHDKVHGLTIGADDYLEKPFSLDELVARVIAVLRRTGPTAQPSNRISVADIALDPDAHLVTKAGHTVHLSPTEFKLLRYLMINTGRVMSKAQILDHVWDYDFEGGGGVVETYIGYLRRKLDNTEPKLIHTVRGIGYTIRLEQ